MTVKRGKRKTRSVVTVSSLRPVELGSEETNREVLRATELGIDLEYDSDKNLLRIYLNLIRHGQIMRIPPAIRGKLARADLITYPYRGGNSVLTQRGKQMLREIKEERAHEEEGKNEMKKPEVEDIRKSITKNANGVR